MDPHGLEAPEPQPERAPDPGVKPGLAGARHGLESVALTGLFLLALVAFLHFSQSILLPGVLALMLFFVLKPVVLAMHRLKIPRPVGAMMVIAIMVGAVITGLSVLQRPAVRFLERAPAGVVKIEEKVTSWVRRLEHITLRKSGMKPGLEPAGVEEGRFTFLSDLNLAELLLSQTTLVNTATFITGLLETIVLLYY